MDNITQAKPKKLGPIRFGAIIPLVLVVGLIWIYFLLFFDTHLRRGIEYTATLANGAEVNIGKLNTSVLDASILLSHIEMTNPELPSRNRVQIGSMNFRMVWDALLRGKVKIDEASINDVEIDTPRKNPGRVLPVKVKEEGEGLGEKVLGQLQEEFSGNVVGDLAAIAGGADAKEQLATLGSDIKSSAYLDGLQKSLDDNNKQWQARLAAMPKAEEFSALQRRTTSVKLDNLQDVSQVQASLKELESIRNEFDAKSKSVSETGTALNDETKVARGTFSDLDKIVKEDVSSLQAKMHLPSLDTRTLSRALFGMDVLGKMQQARHYMDQARSYMPAKSDKKDDQAKAAVVSKREKGRDYVFGQPNSYPAFWLRRAVISSRLDKGVSELSGEILDLTSNPPLVGRPMIATIKGNFPLKGIYGINASLLIDHTSTAPIERLVMEVAQYTVAGRSLVNSPAVEFGFSKAASALKIAAELREDNVDVRINNQFTNVDFQTKAQSQVVREMMAASVAGLNTVNLNAKVTGTWSQLDWQLSSNLGDALVRGMQRYLQEKMDAARARIEALVNDKIKEQRQRLYAKQAEIESTLKSALNERQMQIDTLRAELDSARNKLQARMTTLVNEQQQKVKKDAGKLLNNLIPKL